MNAETHLNKVIDFVTEEFCEVSREDCEECTHYDDGNCPILLAQEYLSEEGLTDE